MTGLVTMRNLDTTLLRSFLAVVDADGVTKAAALLHLTQAAVSQHVKRLEDVLGQPLFLRDGKRLHLSAAGERLLGKAREFMAMNDDIWTMMTAPEFVGELRLGVPHDIVMPLIPPVLRRFDADFPRVNVVIISKSSQDLLADLESGAIDLCLTTEQRLGRGGERLYVEPLVWVTMRAGCAWQRDPLPIALGDEHCAFREPMLDALSKAGRSWRIVSASEDSTAGHAVVAADIAVCTYLSSSIPADFEALPPGTLPELPQFGVNLYLASANLSPSATEMARYLREALGPGRAKAA